jgi:hypothetical protein
VFAGIWVGVSLFLVRVFGISPVGALLGSLAVGVVASGGGGITWYVYGPGRPIQLKFFDAIRRGNLEAVRAFVESRAVAVSQTEGSGFTALDRAAEKGRTEIVRFLIDKGAREYHLYALVGAASQGHSEIVRLLISAEIPPYGREAALMEACRRGHVEVVRLLVRAGANVNAKRGGFWPWEVRTPITVAKKRGYQDILNILTAARNGTPANDPGETLPLFDKEKGTS